MLDKATERHYKEVMIGLFGVDKAKRYWEEFEQMDVLIDKGICKTLEDIATYHNKYGTYDYKDGNSIK